MNMQMSELMMSSPHNYPFINLHLDQIFPLNPAYKCMMGWDHVTHSFAVGGLLSVEAVGPGRVECGNEIGRAVCIVLYTCYGRLM